MSGDGNQKIPVDIPNERSCTCRTAWNKAASYNSSHFQAITASLRQINDLLSLKYSKV